MDMLQAVVGGVVAALLGPYLLRSIQEWGDRRVNRGGLKHTKKYGWIARNLPRK